MFASAPPGNLSASYLPAVEIRRRRPVLTRSGPENGEIRSVVACESIKVVKHEQFEAPKALFRGDKVERKFLSGLVSKPQRFPFMVNDWTEFLSMNRVSGCSSSGPGASLCNSRNGGTYEIIAIWIEY